MAACETCGQKAGFGRKLCDSCEAKAAEQRSKEREAERARLNAEQQARREAEEERRRQEEVARQQRFEKFKEDRIAELHALVKQGVTPYLYSMIFINAQSTMNGETVGQLPDLTEMQQYGWLGWEAVGTVPSTYGEALKNVSYGASSGTTWGAGIGGIVVGAYVLMRFAITQGVLEERQSYIVSLIENEFPG